MAASALASRRRWPRLDATSRSGAATPTRTKRGRDHGRLRRQGRYPHLRRQRSRLGQDRDGGDAEPFRSGRRLLCQCRHRRRRPPRLYRPHRRTMAQHVRDQPRRRVPRVSGRGPPHDRTRRPPATRLAGWSRPRASRRCSAPRATSITPRPRPRINALCPGARRRTGAPRRHRQRHFARLDQERHDRRSWPTKNSSPT